MRKTILFGLIFLSIGFVFAEKQVMLVSDLNTPDLFAASSAGSYKGVPVISLHNGLLDENVTATLTDMAPEEVILIGGPAVISEDVENELTDSGYTITRLWGIERTRTALQIAKYFWDQASCAVLVEDTYDPENDSTVQTEALTEAGLNGCPLIPVPRGVIPAEVLETLSDLNITQIRYIGREINDDIRDSLDGFNLTEVVGKLRNIRNKIVARALTKANAMVIAATPHWNEINGIGAALNNNSVVRRVITMDDLPDVITLIQDNNISPIKVVGNAYLAGQIVNELAANNITAVSYAGPNVAATARRLWKAEQNRFIARKAIVKAVANQQMARVKTLLNNTQSAIDELETEIEALSANGVNTTELESLSVEAESLLKQANGNVTINQALAKRLMNNALNKIKQRMWVNRKLINWAWRNKLQDETQNKKQILGRLKIAAVEGNLTAYTNACGSADEIQELVNKAKELRDDAETEKDPAKAASLLREAKKNVDQARNLGKVCIKKKAIPQKLKAKVAKVIQRAEANKEKVIARATRVLNRLRSK